MRNLRNSKGFTLIELMIVVVIIGILAAIAIPKFTDVAKSSKEAEADPVLKQAFTLQQSYLQRYDAYATTDAFLANVGWDAAQEGKYYKFDVKSATANTAFCVDATPWNEGVASKANVAAKKIDATGAIVKGTC